MHTAINSYDLQENVVFIRRSAVRPPELPPSAPRRHFIKEVGFPGYRISLCLSAKRSSTLAYICAYQQALHPQFRNLEPSRKRVPARAAAKGWPETPGPPIPKVGMYVLRSLHTLEHTLDRYIPSRILMGIAKLFLDSVCRRVTRCG